MTYLFTKIKLPGKNFWDNYNPSELLVVLINVCVIHRERIYHFCLVLNLQNLTLRKEEQKFNHDLFQEGYYIIILEVKINKSV